MLPVNPSSAIEILSIGTEIVSGAIVNTNAAFISQELAKVGYQILRHTAIPDDATLLREGLKDLFGRCSVIIATGGLGPTLDDITRRVAADYFGLELHYNYAVAEDLKSRYGEVDIHLENQATVPKGAHILRNKVGTAPGLVLSDRGKTLILLPGVPLEMKSMLLEEAIPYLQRTLPAEYKSIVRTIDLFNMTEPRVDPVVRQIEKDYPEVQAGIYPSYGLVAIRLSVPDEEKCRVSLENACSHVLSHFRDHMYESPTGLIEEAVHRLFIQSKLTLSVAESCTGGSIAARLTKIPGASNYFLGSIVSYSNELKQNLLHVSPETLARYGAVSEQTAMEMAIGLLQQIDSDFGIAVTGIAGPAGGTPEKPVGTVWGAIIKRGSPPRAWKFQAFGSREMIIEYSVNAILAELLKSI